MDQSLFTDPEQFFQARSSDLWTSSLVLVAVGIVGLGLLPPIVALVESPLLPTNEC